MKEIKAYIKPHKVSELTIALYNAEEVSGMSIVDVKGFGRDRQQEEGAEELVDLVGRTKVEVICKDEHVGKIISIIEQTAHTGLKGDGKIYVYNIESAVRISTGERGENAV